MTTIDERLDQLDQDHIDAAAEFAAEQLALTGIAKVRLAPGDMTEYRILVAAPGIEWAYGDEGPGRYHWVALCASFGAGYEWNGRDVHGSYAAEKWTNRGVPKAQREWTGAVVARFLTALNLAMGHLAAETAE